MGLFQEQCRRLGPGHLPSWTPEAGDGPRSEEIRASGCAQQHLDHQDGPHLVGPRSPGQRVKEGRQRPGMGGMVCPGWGGRRTPSSAAAGQGLGLRLWGEASAICSVRSNSQTHCPAGLLPLLSAGSPDLIWERCDCGGSLASGAALAPILGQFPGLQAS